MFAEFCCVWLHFFWLVLITDLLHIVLQALASLSCLDESESKESMEGMVSYVLDRLY